MFEGRIVAASNKIDADYMMEIIDRSRSRRTCDILKILTTPGRMFGEMSLNFLVGGMVTSQT
jgi:hypothetical protein